MSFSLTGLGHYELACNRHPTPDISAASPGGFLATAWKVLGAVLLPRPHSISHLTQWSRELVDMATADGAAIEETKGVCEADCISRVSTMDVMS